jgi:hypothetical protein
MFITTSGGHEKFGAEFRAAVAHCVGVAGRGYVKLERLEVSGAFFWL